MKNIALVLIRFYQRFISPYKGFACAYRVHTGCASCSGLGYRAIRRYGVIAGIGLLKMRIHRCGVAYRRFAVVTIPRSKQAGFCEILELGGAAAHGVSDIACCACELADWQRSDKKKAEDVKEEEKYVYIPSRITDQWVEDAGKDKQPPDDGRQP